MYHLWEWTNQEGWDPKHHMADVVGIGDISRYHHLTGSHREIQTPQNSCENLKREKQKNNSDLRDLHVWLFIRGLNVIKARDWYNWVRSSCLCLSVTHAGAKNTDQNSYSAEMQPWCKSLLVSHKQKEDKQGNLIVCFSDEQQWPWNIHHEPKLQRSHCTW